MSDSRKFFEDGGAIARELPGYETRPQQIQMAEVVEEAITSFKNLIVEAGTGVGKSLAYLVPFVNWAVREDKKVVISTYTKALQNQLFIKDLPFLSRALDVNFRYALCMGSENYVCLRKAQKNSTGDLFQSKKEETQIKKITSWLEETETGLVTDMDFVPGKAIWSKFSRESDLCLGRKCPHRKQCFYSHAREKQAEAHILITNHALLFTDVAQETQVLPVFQGLVLDEAHTLEDIATNHFGSEFSKASFQRLVESVKSLISDRMVDLNLINSVGGVISEVSDRIKEVQDMSDSFFKETAKVLGADDKVTWFDKDEFSYEDLKGTLEDLAVSLESLATGSKGFKDKNEVAEAAKTYAQRCGKLSKTIDSLFAEQKEEYVYWAEIKTWKSRTNYSFRAAPIDVSDHMRSGFFKKICPVVLTSATLSSFSGKKHDFNFIKRRLGLDDPLELVLDSPFDYSSNVMVYLPRGIADPNSNFDTYGKQVRENIVNIYDIMGGRIFALFTSYAMLNAVAANIMAERDDINILKQGDLPRYVLLDVFKRNPDSILMGTMTFWQGVDVPGEALECVIITKLPFSVPSDPVNSFRIKSMRDKGLNPFNEYQVPQAVIMFKQGIGRLIRSHSDRGIIVVLDPRVRTRSYGGQFISALPKCKQTDNIEEIRNFFS